MGETSQIVTTMDERRIPPLAADPGMVFESGKVWTHSSGFSCTFRQWRAHHSHCRFLHGYALQVEITFRNASPTGVNDINWVMDFGGLKPIKEWIASQWDHKTVIARDDPEFNTISALAEKGIVDLTYMDHVGCEAFAKAIYEHTMWWLTEAKIPYVYVESVEVREHESNYARYRRIHDGS